MNRSLVTIVISIMVILLIILAFITYSQNSEQKYRIGVLMTGENRTEKLDGMKLGLSQLGYRPDQFEFIVKDAKDEIVQMRDYAKELVDDHLDLIVTLGGLETQLVHEYMSQTSKDVPVVFIGIAAPYELGLIEEYYSPGSSFTGVNNFQMNLSAKRLEMFVNLVPNMERVIVLYNQNIDISAMSLKIVEEAAEKLKTPIFPYDIQADPLLERLDSHLTSTDGIMILPSYQIEAMAGTIAELALKWQLPSMGIYDHEVEAGYLFGYGSSYFSQGYQAARYVSLILQGNSPATIPVELPDEIQFFVNDDVRNALNIKLTTDILNLAEVIRGNNR